MKSVGIERGTFSKDVAIELKLTCFYKQTVTYLSLAMKYCYC